jgi:hypothetical protein
MRDLFLLGNRSIIGAMNGDERYMIPEDRDPTRGSRAELASLNAYDV